MKRYSFQRLVSIAVFLFIATPIVEATGHPDCGDCEYWDEQQEECIYWCGSGIQCCTDSGEYCCPWDLECCQGNCVNHQCSQNEHCCSDAVDNYCCPDGEQCCQGSCCEADEGCYDGKCYPSCGNCEFSFTEGWCMYDEACGCDPLLGGCDDKKQIRAGETPPRICWDGEGGKCVNLGKVLCRKERNCDATGYHMGEMCYSIDPDHPEGYCTTGGPYCQDCEGLGLWHPIELDDEVCCFN